MAKFTILDNNDKTELQQQIGNLSYNDLKNKPFYDTRKEVSWEYTFDGNIDGSNNVWFYLCSL